MEQLKETGKARSKGLPSKERSAVKKQYKAKEKKVLIAGIVILLGILAYLKYCNFFIQNINRIFAASGSGFHLNPQNLLIPIGISFYTLEAIGYMADVYWGRIKAEHNFGKVALFLGFFPQIMEGPISSWNDTADALWECRPVRSENLTKGIIRIAWGLFKKIVVADRLSVLVAAIYDDYTSYHGVMIVVVAIAYTLQLYMEFSGCMDIVIGSGNLFGVDLPENFRQPFFAGNASEFWRRWHITLGTWMKDYIFYPMSLSKKMNKFGKWGKKHFGNTFGRTLPICFANIVIFFIVGIWHGAAWKYIAYGLYNGFIIAISNLLEPVYKKLLSKFHINATSRGWTLWQIIRTFILVNIGWYFDMADSVSQALCMIRWSIQGLSFSQLNSSLLDLGIEARDYIIIIAGCIIVFIISVLKEKGIAIRESIAAKPLAVRWAAYYALIAVILIFGYIGATQGFIYANF